MSRQNIEAKFKNIPLKPIVEHLRELGAKTCFKMDQFDTYLNASEGRLKIRRQTYADNVTFSWLVPYIRPPLDSAQLSEYALIPIKEQELQLLEKVIGVTKIVKKHRTRMKWRDVNVHLDIVEGVGECVEFESVVGPNSEEQARADLDELVKILGLENAQRIEGGYADLV